MQNKLIDLNNHLFEELERLNDEDLKDDKLDHEIKRSEAICKVSTQIIANADLVLNATKLQLEYSRDGSDELDRLKQLTGGK